MSKPEVYSKGSVCRSGLRTRINTNGKEIIDRKGGTHTEDFGASVDSMQTLRAAARLLAEVSPLPHLFSRAGAPGPDPRRREVELVKTFSISDCRFPVSKSAIGNWQSTIIGVIS